MKTKPTQLHESPNEPQHESTPELGDGNGFDCALEPDLSVQNQYIDGYVQSAINVATLEADIAAYKVDAATIEIIKAREAESIEVKAFLDQHVYSVFVAIAKHIAPLYKFEIEHTRGSLLLSVFRDDVIFPIFSYRAVVDIYNDAVNLLVTHPVYPNYTIRRTYGMVSRLESVETIEEEGTEIIINDFFANFIAHR